jgi:hypothetical protein
MVVSREEGARRAEASTTNTPGMCQAWTHDIFEAPAVGDVDHDGDADAVDGWESEPVSARHPGDRHPPRGVPVAYSGGNGHRAVSIGGGKIRTTDGNGNGHVATRDLDWPEKTWGKKYLGWTETISGLKIPDGSAPKPDPKPAPTRRIVADYSFARPDLTALARAGVRGVMRYVPIGSKKDLTADEAKQIHARGMWLAVVLETTSGRAGEGAAAGREDVKRAEAAMDKLGYPDDAVIFYAVDVDATPDKVRPYFEAVKAGAKRPVGAYGGVKIIDGLVGSVAEHGWQTEAWSGGKVSEHASMLQRATHRMTVPGVAATAWDENELRGERTWRVWLPTDKPAPAPKPTPHPAPKPDPKPTPKPDPSLREVTIRIGGHNGQVGHKDSEKQVDLNRIEPQLHACTLCEWGTYGGVHPAPGMVRFDGTGKPGQASTPIDYRPDMFVPGTITTGAFLLTEPTKIGAAGPGPTVTKTKWVMWVRGQLKGNGRWLRICGVHWVPTPHLNAAREHLGDEQVDDLGAVIEKWQGEGPVAVVGDLNRTANDPDLARLKEVGMTIVASSGVMHVMLKMREKDDQRITHVTDKVIDGGHSDHDVPVAEATFSPAAA